MKKFIILLMLIGGFLSTDVNAQSCCKSKKECKPVVCCPTTPDCCKTTKSIEGTTATAIKVGSAQQSDRSTPIQEKHPLKKEEKLVVLTKID